MGSMWIRNQHTKKPDDIKKVADYANLWAGIESVLEDGIFGSDPAEDDI
jgi:hypothetical protein